MPSLHIVTGINGDYGITGPCSKQNAVRMKAQAADRPYALAKEALVVPDDTQNLSIHVEDLLRCRGKQTMMKLKSSVYKDDFGTPQKAARRQYLLAQKALAISDKNTLNISLFVIKAVSGMGLSASLTRYETNSPGMKPTHPYKTNSPV